MNEWFSDEDFWKELYPYLFPEKRIELAVEEVRQLLELCGSGGGRVLDLMLRPGAPFL